MTWLHNESYFSEEKVREQARKYGFSDPIQVEFFLWDCEIAAQLQRESEDFVLKGGAAVQLHLPVEMQRGSVDVDIVAPKKKEEIVEVLSQIHKRIPSVEFEKYTPKRPHKEINMVTYLAKVQPLIPSKNGRLREVKIDFLLEDVKLPIQMISNKETFALTINQLKCYSVSSLIGDKILTLAENTIGISDLPDVPKQIYDVSVLSKKQQLTLSDFSEIFDAIETIVPLEAKYREQELTVLQVLDDIEKTMDKYALSDTAEADAGIKRNIVNFQQFYVSSSQKWPLYVWSARVLKIRFLCRLLKPVFDGKVDLKEAFNQYSTAELIDQTLSTIKGDKVKTVNKTLRDLADTQIPCFRELKGKPLNRVFWQVVSSNNISKINELVKESV
ncbi:MAG: nucleotidyl transferase AbiEii/AbiGii toxin family protein [Candidatus Bathyarchaeia archaeon]